MLIKKGYDACLQHLNDTLDHVIGEKIRNVKKDRATAREREKEEESKAREKENNTFEEQEKGKFGEKLLKNKTKDEKVKAKKKENLMLHIIESSKTNMIQLLQK